MPKSNTAKSLKTSVDLDPVLMKRLIYVATLAASPDNNQPWRFETGSDRLRLFYEDKRALATDKKHLLNYLSLGMALENLRLAALYEGLEPQIAFFPDPDNRHLVSEITFSPGGSSDPLYHYVFTRRTDRGSYRTTAVPPDCIREMEAAFKDTGALLVMSQDRKNIRRLANVTGSMEAVRLANRTFHSEIYRNVKFKRKELLQTRIGIDARALKLPPGFLFPFRLMRSWVVLNVLRVFGSLAATKALLRYRFIRSGAAGIVATRDNEVGQIVEAGRALQRLWLIAEKHGLSFQPFATYPVISDCYQDPGFVFGARARRVIRRCIGAVETIFPALKENKPILCFRLGYGKREFTSSIRLSPDEVTVAPPRLVKPSPENVFNFETAFSRSIGLVSKQELQTLRQKTIAIPGLGGVGGIHLVTLARMGIGGFHIADADTFSLSNFNRQYGAMLPNIGEKKNDVMASIARQINPELRLRVWPEFVMPANVDEFLTGCDLVVDSLDAFAIKARQMVFKRALEMGIPVVTAGPLGFSSSMLVFLPGAMSFDRYFNYDEKRPIEDNFLDFILGVAPRPYFLSYMNKTEISSEEQRGPSSAASVHLCAGFAGVEALKILLGRGKVNAVPHYHYFDAYLMKFRIGYSPWGGKNPIRRLIFQNCQQEAEAQEVLIRTGNESHIRRAYG